MFIISLTYKVPLDQIEPLISEHNDFPEKYYHSGRKEPRTGGIILFNASSEKEIEKIIQEDPFYTHQTANYDIMEFIPSKYNEHFKFFI